MEAKNDVAVATTIGYHLSVLAYQFCYGRETTVLSHEEDITECTAQGAHGFCRYFAALRDGVGMGYFVEWTDVVVILLFPRAVFFIILRL